MADTKKKGGDGTINMRMQHPMMLVERMLAMQALKEIGADKIDKLESKYHVFLLEEVDDETEKVTLIINWEFALFKATNKQLEDLVANFVKVEAKQEENKSNLILPNTPEIETGDRPNLIL